MAQDDSHRPSPYSKDNRETFRHTIRWPLFHDPIRRNNGFVDLSPLYWSIHICTDLNPGMEISGRTIVLAWRCLNITLFGRITRHDAQEDASGDVFDRSEECDSSTELLFDLE
jgi:hypothetical protein